ncbi:MAG: hypothetical protein H6713_40900 [Myxococcales bacterium]|nr:hypothetical protein [Myxococcales bacterium]
MTIPSEGPGSLECCEAIETAGPAVEVSAMISAVERAGFACLELADAKSAQRAVSACIRKLGRATVKACVVVDDPEMPSCAAQTYAATVDDRVLLGLGSDLQLEDYGWSVVELRAGEAHVLYPHGAPYVNPYCDDEEAREPGRDAELAKIPAHVERAPEAVRRWICSGPPG